MSFVRMSGRFPRVAVAHPLQRRDAPYTRHTRFYNEAAMTRPIPDDTSYHTSETAETMLDVRHEIDRLDRALVKLLAERQTFMDAAARIKGHRTAVLDRPRIEDVVTKVLAEAKRQNLSAAIAEPVWRTLIDRSIAYEFRSYDALKPEDIDN